MQNPYKCGLQDLGNSRTFAAKMEESIKF
jgi:hypothetical protein